MSIKRVCLVAGLLCGFTVLGCRSWYPEWGHGSGGEGSGEIYPEPTETPTPEPTPEPTAEPTPEPAPGRVCDPQVEGQPADCDCYHMPPGSDWLYAPCPAPTPEPTSEPTPTPTPEPAPEACGFTPPSEPISVVNPSIPGRKLHYAGMTVAASSCHLTSGQAPQPNGRCLASDLPEGALAPSESECRSADFWIYGQTLLHGMACAAGETDWASGDPKERGCWDALERRVKKAKNGDRWILVAHSANGVVLSSPERSWSYHALCPPEIVLPCPEPTPTPTPTPEPVDTTDCLDSVVRIGMEWGIQAGGDRCSLPQPNQSIDVPAGKDCHLTLSASPRAGDGSHVGDRPECYALVRPYWFQADQCASWGPTGECVDLEPHDAVEPGAGTWYRTEDGRGYFAKFDLDFQASGQNWVKACLPTPHGVVCSVPLHLRHR